MLHHGAALAAQLAASATAATAAQTKITNNRTRLNVLATKAGKHAKDPAANPALTAREINEFLARLWLSERAEDV